MLDARLYGQQTLATARRTVTALPHSKPCEPNTSDYHAGAILGVDVGVCGDPQAGASVGFSRSRQHWRC